MFGSVRHAFLVGILMLTVFQVAQLEDLELEEHEVDSAEKLDDELQHHALNATTETSVEELWEMMNNKTEEHTEKTETTTKKRGCKKSEICPFTGRCPQPGKYPSNGGCAPPTL